MKFPVVVIKEKESPIYFFDKEHFGLVSKGGEEFYKNSTIYDSEGTVFVIQNIEGVIKAPILKSIKYFQPMFLANFKTEMKEKIQLEIFKKIVIDHIEKHSKYWENKDTIEDLKGDISNMKSFSAVIAFLR